MKRQILFSVLIVIISSSVFGQNYQTINSKRICYFEHSSTVVRSIRVDSIKQNDNDSILYPYAVFQQIGDYCFSPAYASWIGKAVIIKEHGLNLFINNNNDTIVIDTKAKLGEEWTVYHIEGDITIKASITNHDTMHFLGLVDSVKTITFQQYNESMNPMEAAVNGMTLLVSKNYGFLRIFNFCVFPTSAYYSQSLEIFEEYNLVGLTNPTLGVQNLTWFEVYDFQPGDEMHILSEFDDFFWLGYSVTRKNIETVLERINKENSIEYTIYRKYSENINWGDSSSYKLYNDTFNMKITPNPDFDKLPQEPILQNGDAMSYNMLNGEVLSKSRSGYEFYLEDTCYVFIVTKSGSISSGYVKGLGGPYYSKVGYDYSSDRKVLVYYKKGEISWGTPLDLTGFEDNLGTANQIFVYPNPTKDFILFKGIDSMKNGLMVEIFDINGINIKSQEVKEANGRLSVIDMKRGMYFYKISDNTGVLSIGKLIIE